MLTGKGAMKYLRARWRCHARPGLDGRRVRADLRPGLALAMCRWCAMRWLSGHSLWHDRCAQRLSYAFDLHFERLHEGP